MFVPSAGQLPDPKASSCIPFQPHLSCLQPLTLFYEAEFSLTLAPREVLKFTRHRFSFLGKRRPVIFLPRQSLWGAVGSSVLYLPCLCSFPIPCCYLWLCCYGREYFLSLLNNCLAARGAHFSLYRWRISWDVWELFPVLSSRGELAGPVPSFDIASSFFSTFPLGMCWGQ